MLPLQIFQGMKNSPIYANQTSSETFRALAHCIQDDLHAGIRHHCMELGKKLALTNLTNVIKRAYEYNIKFKADKTKIGLVHEPWVRSGVIAISGSTRTLCLVITLGSCC